MYILSMFIPCLSSVASKTGDLTIERQYAIDNRSVNVPYFMRAAIGLDSCLGMSMEGIRICVYNSLPLLLLKKDACSMYVLLLWFCFCDLQWPVVWKTHWSSLTHLRPTHVILPKMFCTATEVPSYV